jgi:hypothetical protein
MIEQQTDTTENAPPHPPMMSRTVGIIAIFIF